MKKLNVKLLSILLSVLLLLFSSFYYNVCSAAELEYKITATQLNKLDQNLRKLEANNQEQQQFCNTLQEQQLTLHNKLTLAKEKSNQLTLQLNDLTVQSMKQEESLKNASKLLEQYAQEEKRKISEIKKQRNVAYVVAAASVYIMIKKL